MADFKTHLMGAAAVSGVAATGLMMTGVASHQAVLGYFTLGVVGGLLPDIDSDTSIPFRIAFSALAVVAGFLVVFGYSQRYSLLELVILWLASFVLIRYGIFTLFNQFTVHRGLIHSIPAGVMFALITTLVAHHIFHATAFHAWFCGAFVLLGFLVHLLLDEMYSVNLTGLRVKSSFGTAFNLGSLNNPFGTAMLYLVVVALFFLSPPLDKFIDIMLDGRTYNEVVNRLLPTRGWFDGLF